MRVWWTAAVVLNALSVLINTSYLCTKDNIFIYVLVGLSTVVLARMALLNFPDHLEIEIKDE